MSRFYALIAAVVLVFGFFGEGLYWTFGEVSRPPDAGGGWFVYLFGGCVVSGAVAALASLWLRRPALSFAFASLLLGLVLLSFVRNAWHKPLVLNQAYRQHSLYRQQEDFWNRHTPKNRNFSKDLWEDIDVGKFKDRVKLVMNLSSWRRVLALCAAFLLAACCFLSVSGGAYRRVAVFLAGVSIAVFPPMLGAYGSLMTHRALNDGLAACGRGDYGRALALMDEALRRDAFYRYDPLIRERQGEAALMSGVESRPECRFYHAAGAWQEGRWRVSFDLLYPLLDEPSLRFAVVARIWDYVSQRAQRAMRKGDYGQARALYLEALARLSLPGAYYVFPAIASYAMRDFETSGRLASVALSEVGHPVTRSRLYLLLGESAWQSGDYGRARILFIEANRLDDTRNYWAYKAMYGGVK